MYKRQIKDSVKMLSESDIVDNILILNCDMGKGKVEIEIKLRGDLYYKVIEELMDHSVEDDSQLFLLLKEYAQMCIRDSFWSNIDFARNFIRACKGEK